MFLKNSNQFKFHTLFEFCNFFRRNKPFTPQGPNVFCDETKLANIEQVNAVERNSGVLGFFHSVLLGVYEMNYTILGITPQLLGLFLPWILFLDHQNKKQNDAHRIRYPACKHGAILKTQCCHHGCQHTPQYQGFVQFFHTIPFSAMLKAEPFGVVMM